MELCTKAAVNPTISFLDSTGDENELIATVMGAQRIRLGDLEFLGP